MSIQAAALYALVGVTGAGQSVRDLQNVSNQADKTQGTLNKLGHNAGEIGKGLTQVGAGLLRIGEVVGVAALAATGAAARIGTTFQAQMELIHTQAGATQKEVTDQTKAVMDLVHTVGTSPIDLAKGLYHIESVGARGAAALDILKASALGAKVGLADMESVTNALTAVWFSGIKGAKSMTDAMAILDGIVGVGNMHLQDLTDSFKSGILGTAATYGVDIRSLGAAIATLTDAGVPADIAATRLNNTLTHLAAPVPGAIDVLKKLGLSQFTLATDLRKPDGLFIALKDLHDHLVKAGEIKNGLLTPQGAADMSKLFGGSRFGATAMQLLTQMDRIEQKYVLITKRSDTFGDNVKKTMETAGFIWGQFKADVENSALAFSQGFLPALARAGQKLDLFLVGHRSDIAKMGTDLGAWIDKIDWKSVEAGANSFVDIMKSVLDVISKIPPQIDLAIIGFLGLNKVSGGLLGKGLENIIGGVVGAGGTLGGAVLRMGLSKIPVVGGAAAALTSTPVYITGIAPGVGLGMGGGGGIPGVALKGEGLLASFGLTVPVMGGLLLGVAAAAGLGILLDNAINAKGGMGPALKPLEGTGVGLGTAPIIYDPSIPKGQRRVFGGKGGGYIVVGTGESADRNSETGGIRPDLSFDTRSEAGGIRMSEQANYIAALAFDTRTEAAATRTAAEALTRAAQKAAEAFRVHLPKSLGDMVSGIEKRSMDKYHWASGHAPDSWVKGTFGRDLLHMERMVLRSHQTATLKLADLKHLQTLAVQGKDWGVARKLKTDIGNLQETIRKQKLEASLTANLSLNVDGRILAWARLHQAQFERANNT